MEFQFNRLGETKDEAARAKKVLSESCWKYATDLRPEDIQVSSTLSDHRIAITKGDGRHGHGEARGKS